MLVDLVRDASRRPKIPAFVASRIVGVRERAVRTVDHRAVREATVKVVLALRFTRQVSRRQIQHAQRQGEDELLDRLLEEKESLTRRRHPDMMGKYW